MRRKGEGRRRERIHIRRVLAEMAATFGESWKLLLAVGVLLFLPVSLISAIGPGEGIEIEEWDGARSAAVIGLGLVQFVVPLLGTVFYAGIVAAVYRHRRDGVAHGIGRVARELPYLRLAVADVALFLAIAFGFLLIIVPGFVFLAWFCLVAPAIELEGLTVRESFRRSRSLVRRSFWPVFALIVPVFVLQGLIEGGGEEAGVHLLGENLIGEWVGNFAGNLLSAPLFALAALVLFHDLRDLVADDERNASG